MTYGDVLRRMLENRRMSAGELAEMIGVPRQSVYSLINGNAKEPKLSRALAIAKALGVPLQDMIDMMGDE